MKVETPIVSKRKEVAHVSAADCEEWIASKPTMIQVQESIGNRSSSMLIDLGSTHNLMSCEFASKVGFPITQIEPCKVFLTNGELSPIECRLLKVLVILQKTQTIVNFRLSDRKS